MNSRPKRDESKLQTASHQFRTGFATKIFQFSKHLGLGMENKKLYNPSSLKNCWSSPTFFGSHGPNSWVIVGSPTLARPYIYTLGISTGAMTEPAARGVSLTFTLIELHSANPGASCSLHLVKKTRLSSLGLVLNSPNSPVSHTTAPLFRGLSAPLSDICSRSYQNHSQWRRLVHWSEEHSSPRDQRGHSSVSFKFAWELLPGYLRMNDVANPLRGGRALLASLSHSRVF